jgi:hypothetical protein
MRKTPCEWKKILVDAEQEISDDIMLMKNAFEARY